MKKGIVDGNIRWSLLFLVFLLKRPNIVVLSSDYQTMRRCLDALNAISEGRVLHVAQKQTLIVTDQNIAVSVANHQAIV